MMNRLLVNGVESTSIDVRDRGLSYGDGVFTTAKIVRGSVQFWQQHLERLIASCARLKFPVLDVALLEQEVQKIVAGHSLGILKIILTRGVGGRGYRPPSSASPTRIIATYPWPHYPVTHWRDGINVRLCESRLSLNSTLAGIKHLNRLEQVLARSEWDDESIQEGLMLDIEGQVIEGTMSNLFIRKDGGVYTPSLANSGVAGIIRQWVIEQLQHSVWSIEEGSLQLEQIAFADEVILTNSVIGIWPVKKMGEAHFQPGELSRWLQDRLGCIPDETDY